MVDRCRGNPELVEAEALASPGEKVIDEERNVGAAGAKGWDLDSNPRDGAERVLVERPVAVRVERAIDGVDGVDVSLEREQVTVRYDAGQAGVAAFKDAIEGAGYDVAG